MGIITINQLAESVALGDQCFKTLRGVHPKMDAFGSPMMIVGGNSIIFIVEINGSDWSLKCHFHPKPNPPAIAKWLVEWGGDLIHEGIEYLHSELWVWDNNHTGQWMDVALKRWHNGHTLNFELNRALIAGDSARIGQLAKMFDLIALKLLDANWAHGDIKFDNIIVGDNRMSLVDYDSCYIPPFEGEPSDELGTPQFRHPRRNRSYFNIHIDDYPIAIVSATLHTLALAPEMHRTFGDQDHILFNPELIAAKKDRGFEAALHIAGDHKNILLTELLSTLNSPVPHINGLGEILKKF